MWEGVHPPTRENFTIFLAKWSLLRTLWEVRILFKESEAEIQGVFKDFFRFSRSLKLTQFFKEFSRSQSNSRSIFKGVATLSYG